MCNGWVYALAATWTLTGSWLCQGVCLCRRKNFLTVRSVVVVQAAWRGHCGRADAHRMRTFLLVLMLHVVVQQHAASLSSSASRAA